MPQSARRPARRRTRTASSAATHGVLPTLLLALTAALLLTAPAHGAPATGAPVEPRASKPVAAQQSAAQAAMGSGRYERRLLRWTNVQRQRHGRRPVRAGRCADRYAEGWTRHMARTGRFEHRDQRVVMRGCDATAAGEVIARGHVTPRRMVRMWMGSDGHRAILLSRRFRRIGIGARHTSNGWLATQNYLRP
jgi:uncharacterized protein YkwD